MRKNFRILISAILYASVFFIIFGSNYFVKSITTPVKENIVAAYELAIDYYFPTEEIENYQSTFHNTVKRIIVSPTNTPTPIPPTLTPTPVVITEEQLWQALVNYRHTHQKSEIQQSESLCVYARERANELINRLKTDPEDPLDAHAGFNRDAESGYVFEKTGFNKIGENLAYTPSLVNATEIIEWGWDTSSGHRQMQLSNDVTHACITGIHPIYVGMFALK